MFNYVKDLENPHTVTVFGLYGDADKVYTEEDWVYLHTAARINLDNLLVQSFLQAVDQFRTEIGVKPKYLKKIPLGDKFVVCSTATATYMDLPELTFNRWVNSSMKLDDMLIAFTGIDPNNIFDLEFISDVSKERPGIELTMRVRMNINPTSGVKYLIDNVE